MSDQSSHQVNLIDLLAFVMRWRKVLIISMITAGVIVAVISFIVPPKYRSVAVVKGSEAADELGGFISSKLAELGGIGGFAPSLGEVPGEMLLTILRSRWMSETVIREFDLAKVYGAEDEPIEDIIDIFKDRSSFDLDAPTQTVEIMMDDRDPQRAKNLVDFIVDQLDDRNQEFNRIQAGKERQFIGARLADSQNYLAMLEDSLTRFQLATGVLDIEEQLKATIQAAAVLEAKKMTTQVELEMYSKIFDENNPTVEMSRIKLASIDSSLQALIRSRGEDEGLDFIIPLADTPEQGMIYLRLIRDIEVHQILVAFLLQKHEQSRIDEIRNTPTLIRVDMPVVATKRIWPRRGMMVILAVAAAFIFASAVCLIVEFFRRAAADPAHAHYQSFQNLKSSVRRRR